jgi:DNA-directed RNA polymerase sigma subunit (sigma70/sigma32)
VGRGAPCSAHAEDVDHFIRQLLSQPPLEAAAERELARRARGGDLAARDALITAGLRSVALRALMLGLRGEELRDAVQSGAVGLIRAVDRFDPERGVRLATYAWQWIGAELTRPVRRETTLDEETGWFAVHPDLADDLLDGMPHVEAEVLRQRFGLGPGHPSPLSRRAVGERLGLSVSQVRTIESKAMRQLRRGLAKVVDRAPVHPGADPP